MKKTIFKGMATAMVTPMTPEGVDYEALGRFIDFQLESGINARVAVGTTGESATLTPEEREKVIAFTIDRVAGRVPVIAGTGTNNTQHAVNFSVSAARAVSSPPGPQRSTAAAFCRPPGQRISSRLPSRARRSGRTGYDVMSACFASERR